MLHTEKICNNRPDPGEPVLGPPQPSLALRKPASLLFTCIPVPYSRGARMRSCQRDSDNPQHSLSHWRGAVTHQPESSPESLPSSGEKEKSGWVGQRPALRPHRSKPCTLPRLHITPGINVPPASQAWGDLAPLPLHIPRGAPASSLRSSFLGYLLTSIC